MTTGTSYFVSLGAAQRYYADYEGGILNAVHAVNRKLDAGEIHIGKPPLAESGQALTIIDNGARYAIVDSPTKHKGILA